MIPIILLLTTFTADPPPLAAQQIEQVRTLVQRTQTEQAAAKRSLLEAQEDLTRCYTEYKLNEKRVGELQMEILTQQKKLLETHHRLQTELRAIVGAERFQVLSRRIENALRSPPPGRSDPSPANK